jgi:uncharacterized protein (DUF1501 family)
MNRRTFLQSTAAGAAGLSLPYSPFARASVGAADLKFIFVFAQGGWDPTRVFATEFSNKNVDMEPDGELMTVGGLTFVDHPDRPSVTAYLQANGARTLFMNGVMIRSISHQICTMISMTGTTSGLTPDWPAILASAVTGRTIPHLVLSGPSFPGDLVTDVARTGSNGQLEALLSGAALDWSDTPVKGLPLPTQNIVDDYIQERANAFATTAATSPGAKLLASDMKSAVAAARDLKNLRYVMDFTGGTTLEDKTQVAVDALSIGLSRCVTLSDEMSWDSHADNDATQSKLFEALFYGLSQLHNKLEATPGAVAPTLADETVVVVLSEMGRTPLLNGFLGKDHWPYTAMMITGPNVLGGRVIGGYDDDYYGLEVDPASGEAADGTQVLSAEAVGATLLAMADIDPAEHVTGVDPILGALS